MTTMLTGLRAALTGAIIGAGALAISACGEQSAGAATGEIEPINGLPDRAIGDPNAPVTIVEFASLSCGHCKTFHGSTFKEIKEKYVDTGQVRYVFREMPTDPQIAVAGALVARCVPEEKYSDAVAQLFERQTAFFEASRDSAALWDSYLTFARSAGLTEDEFQACLRDEAEIERLNEVGVQAEAQFGIRSTPSFVIGEEVLSGARPIEDFDAILEPLLAGQ